MKRDLWFILFMVTTLVSNASEISSNNKVQQQDSPKVILYADDSAKKVVQTLPIRTRLIRIYQKGDWIKVGSPNDGTIGWVRGC